MEGVLHIFPWVILRESTTLFPTFSSRQQPLPTPSFCVFTFMHLKNMFELTSCINADLALFRAFTPGHTYTLHVFPLSQCHNFACISPCQHFYYWVSTIYGWVMQYYEFFTLHFPLLHKVEYWLLFPLILNFHTYH